MKYWIFISVRDMPYPILVCSSEENLLLDGTSRIRGSQLSSRIDSSINSSLGNDVGRVTYAVCCTAALLPYPFFMIFNSSKEEEEETLDMMFVDSYETMFNWSKKSVAY